MNTVLTLALLAAPEPAPRPQPSPFSLQRLTELAVDAVPDVCLFAHGYVSAVVASHRGTRPAKGFIY